MGLLAHAQRHQLVPGRVKVDLVDAVAEAVMGPQLGRKAIGLPRQRLHMGAADRGAGLRKPGLRPAGADDAHDGAQRRIGRVGVVVRQRRRLVQDLVRRVAVTVGHRHFLSRPFQVDG